MAIRSIVIFSLRFTCLDVSVLISHQKKIQHLYLRAGFSEVPWKIDRLKDQDLLSIVEGLFADSASYKQLNYLPYPIAENRERKGASAAQLIAMILSSKQDSEELDQQWIFKLTHTKAVLREKMVFFWHNHFATSVPFSYLMQVQNNTIRSHALGSFRDLLFAVAKDPAMIMYLNNAENKKGHPNENFAREVMELFTLGIGNYSEKDIQEAARAFTGWSVDTKGEFVFRPEVHDMGIKTFMGKSGDFKGEDILDILLQNRGTATFIVRKIYKEFVNPVPDESLVAELSDRFYASGYDISGLMRTIFTSEWFYDENNIGVKIVSPVELIVRYNKLVSLEFKKPKSLIRLQQALGQILFFPPNVAGWPGDRKWIDSASLLLRLNLPRYIVNGSMVGLKSRPAFEESPEKKPVDVSSEKVYSDWSPFIRHFRNYSKDVIPDKLLECLIQSDTARVPIAELKNSLKDTSDEDIIRTAARIMSLPEFQLI